MSIADYGPKIGKHCFTYCGDDLCDCELAPRYQDWPAQVGTHPKGGDAKQAPGASLSDAVGEADAPAPSPSFQNPKRSHD